MAPSDVLASVLHRTASSRGLEGACWEYSVVRGIHAPRPTVTARVVLGAHVYDVEIPVCTSRKPRPMSWPIRRLGGETWRISGARYGYDVAREMTQPTPFEEGMPVGSLELSACPPDILDELLAIDDVPT
jgi:hypothetical protein